MPFDTSFDDIYALGIRPACEAANAYCERVDEQMFHESILKRIYNQIAKADVIVADLTARNPNVFYETGYAHALGKQVVLLTQNADDIPFDLKHYPHIIYGGSILKLKQELERRVRWCIEAPITAGNLAAEKLEFYIRGQKVGDGDVISIPTVVINNETFPFELSIAIHNAGGRVYHGSGGNDLGLIVPGEFKIHDFGDEEDEDFSVQLPDGRSLHTWGPMKRILPDGWEKLQMMVSVRQNGELFEKNFPIIIRLFTEIGPKDLIFSIRFERDAAA